MIETFPIMLRGDPILVEWSDAAALHGWMDAELLTNTIVSGPAKCTTAGLFFWLDDVCITVMQTQHDDNNDMQYGEALMIPLGVVTGVHRLIREPETQPGEADGDGSGQRCVACGGQLERPYRIVKACRCCWERFLKERILAVVHTSPFVWPDNSEIQLMFAGWLKEAHHAERR